MPLIQTQPPRQRLNEGLGGIEGHVHWSDDGPSGMDGLPVIAGVLEDLDTVVAHVV